MSNFGGIHSIVKYEAGKSKAFTGQRLAKFAWKTDKETGIKKESKCVSIPQFDNAGIKDNIDALIPHIKSYLEGIQDQMIRIKIESKMNENENLDSVIDSEIGIASIIQFLESEGNSESSGRITKESVKEWFDSEISELLALRLAEKLGVSEIPTDSESEKIMKVIAAFGDKVSMLSSGKTKFPKEVARSVKSAIELASESKLQEMFLNRLDKMIEADSEIDLLMSL